MAAEEIASIITLNMVKVGNDNKYFQCEECGFKYLEKEWAEKCEAWCKEHNSCNLEIIRNSVQPDNSSFISDEDNN